MATAFHYFPELPTELREIIWSMSLEPREIFLDVTDTKIPAHNYPTPFWHVSTKLPATFFACRESRQCLKPLYTKAFRSPPGRCTRTFPNRGSYTLINFDIDTIRTDALSYVAISPEADLVLRVTVEIHSADAFHYRMSPMGGHDRLYMFKNLKDVTFIHLTYSKERSRELPYYDEYIRFFREYYYTCTPVKWYARVICPSFPDEPELNRDNYKQWNGKPGWQHQKPVKRLKGDSWHHPLEGCDCPAKKKFCITRGSRADLLEMRSTPVGGV